MGISLLLEFYIFESHLALVRVKFSSCSGQHLASLASQNLAAVPFKTLLFRPGLSSCPSQIALVPVKTRPAALSGGVALDHAKSSGVAANPPLTGFHSM